MSHLVDIIIPTFNNRGDLEGCLASLFVNHSPYDLFRVIVVNNGEPQSCDWIAFPHVIVMHPGRNLGWEGALELALGVSSAPYVCFLNDDTFVPPVSRLWLDLLLQYFDDPRVGAVGPSSNFVMGWQSIFHHASELVLDVRYLIGFCLLVCRTALEEAGGIDTSLPGGDDLDLSIRLREAGYMLLIDREVFVFHHGARTGFRVHGAASEGGWYSDAMTMATNHALIAKHGFQVWDDTLRRQVIGAYVFPDGDDATTGNDAEPV